MVVPVWTFVTWSRLAILMALALLAGCQSTAQPGSGSHASVRVSGATEKNIRQAVTSVFPKQWIHLGLGFTIGDGL